MRRIDRGLTGQSAPAGRATGFTLIEVLLVVVIIAILAALILPRFMNMTERAVIAEAQTQLGAIKRGQLKWQDMTEAAGGATTLITRCGASQACDPDEWALIGVMAPAAAAFDYECDNAGTCMATRVSPNVYNDATIQLDVNTSVWNCGGTGVRPYVNSLAGRGCSDQ